MPVIFVSSVLFLDPQFSHVVSDLCGWTREDIPHPSRHFVNEFMRSLVVIEWFGWKMPQGCRCQPYAGPTPNEREWVSGLQSSLVMSTGVIRLCVLLCLHTLVDLARQDSVWL